VRLFGAVTALAIVSVVVKERLRHPKEVRRHDASGKGRLCVLAREMRYRRMPLS
jgi:hypothetical protein